MNEQELRRAYGLAVLGCLLIAGHLADHALAHGQETMPFAAIIAVTVVVVAAYRRAPTWLRVGLLSIVALDAIVKGFTHVANLFRGSVTGLDLSGAGEVAGGVLLLLVALWEFRVRLRRGAARPTRVAA